MTTQQLSEILESDQGNSTRPTASQMAERLSEPEFRERMRRKREKLERESAAREQANREGRWKTLIHQQIGIRYAESRLDNFEIDDSSKHQLAAAAVVSDLRGFCDDIEGHVRNGDGLLLHGPIGSGKDHLLTAVLRVSILSGFTVAFVNGMDLFQQLRDAMRTGGAERTVLKDLSSVDILALSDPVPPKGQNSEFELESLFGLIDRRYRQLKSTFLTINVADRNEANERIAPQIVDRVAHNALSLHCNWPTYRKPLAKLKVAESGSKTA